MMNCPFCGTEISNLEGHLRVEHFLGIQDYYEMEPIRPDEEKCCKCGQYRYPLTYIEPEGYFLPHWNCIRAYERTQYVRSVRSSILEYYGKVFSDRFLQMFLLGDIYFSSTKTHTYEEFKAVLKGLQKQDRNKLWFLDWLPGFPKVICKENLEGIKVVPVDEYYTVKSEKGEIAVNDYTIKFAELIPFDFRHHSRYNLFNQSPTARQVKRLRLKDEKDQCIRFEVNSGSAALTMFRIEVGGERIDPCVIGELDLLVIKLMILRNKTFMRLVQTVFTELLSNAALWSDSVFLRNTISLGEGVKGSPIHLSWLPNMTKDNYINISIL